MLIEFSVENFGPFRDEVTLDMRKGAGSEHPDNSMGCAQIGGEVLRFASVFGKNASGKSYLLRAIGSLCDFLRAVPAPNSPISVYNPFRLSKETVEAPTRMRVRFVHGGVLYDYTLAFDRTEIVEEKLTYRPNGRSVTVFNRVGQEFTVSRQMSKQLNPLIDMTARNAPFMTVAAQFNNDVCRKAHEFLTQYVVFIGDNPLGILEIVVGSVNRNPSVKERMTRALSIADFGICGIIEEFDDGKAKLDSMPAGPRELLKILRVPTSSFQLSFEHRFEKADVENQEFPFQIESYGTMQMFCVMGPVVDALENGRVLLLDEFGSSLHADISRWIVSQFCEPSNPNGAQLIVNTHNLMIMDTDILLRRDQILFTDKDETRSFYPVRPLRLHRYTQRPGCPKSLPIWEIWHPSVHRRGGHHMNGRRTPPATSRTKPRLLIVVEGESEVRYFQQFKSKHHRMTIVVEKSKHPDPVYIINDCIREIRKLGMDFKAGDRAAVVFDVDENKNIIKISKRCRDNGIEMYISNPCFEYWLCLHYGAVHRVVTRRDLVNLMSRNLGRPYRKGQDISRDITRDMRRDAIARAEECLCDSKDPVEECLTTFPSTTVHLLVRSIEALAEEERSVYMDTSESIPSHPPIETPT